MRWRICGRWIFCCGSSKLPIHIVDGEKRLYYSTHKYSVIEPAPASYLFEEIDKLLHAYGTNKDTEKQRELRHRWIYYKNYVRLHYASYSECMQKLAEKQVEFRKITATIQ